MKNETLILLNNLISNGTISSGIPLKQAEEIMNKYLKMHNYAIWQNKKGNFTTYLPTEEGGRKQISSTTLDGLNKKLITYYKGIYDNPTFEDVFNNWMEEKLETDISKATYDRYRTDFSRFFDDEFKAIKIADLSENQIVNHIKHTVKAQSLTYKAYNGLRTIIMGVLKYAKANGLSNISATSLFDGLELNKRNFRKDYKPDESQIYTEADVKRLVHYLENDSTNKDYALAILLLLRTGLRIGELGAIKKCDVGEDSIFINRQYISYKGEKGKRIYKTVEYTKSRAGIREIILIDKAKEIVSEACAMHPENEYLFSHQGRQLTSSVCNYYLRNACQTIGIRYRSVHKIRKTFATTLLNGGVDESFVKTIMGHEDINTTKSHYYYCNKRKKDYENQIKSAIVI